MSDIAIHVENLGKQYHIGALQKNGGRYTYKSLRDSISSAASAPFRMARALVGGNGTREIEKDETIWALKDVSFDVKRGEIVGVIGRNGAGKSTLLKVLSRITEPNTGFAEIHGRVGSLLEVGTGFHPELSGRDNVYMNGAILGMKRAEIARQFDAIVAFAEVEKFIDTPVKHYSSGMYLRLAFAVAAHLQTEILMVDEVLAVGDLQFQKKCLKKMQDVSTNECRTVLFVSHNMAAIRSLCETGILLDRGSVAFHDNIEAVTAAYTSLGEEFSSAQNSVILPKAPDRCDVWMESVTVLCNEMPSTRFEFGDRLGFKIDFRASSPVQRPIIGYLIRSSRGENAVNANNYFLPSPDYQHPVTVGSIICDLGELPLMAGYYSVSFWSCSSPHEHHHVEDVLHFTVEERDIWGSSRFPDRSVSSLWWPTEFRFLDRETV
jgi:lipopolysaccharide transport system ATP-binding protein